MSRLQERLQRLRRSGASSPGAGGVAASGSGGEPTFGAQGETTSGEGVEAASVQPSDAATAGVAAEEHVGEPAAPDDALTELDGEWRRLNAVLIRNEYGDFIRRTVRVPLDRMHGRIPLGTLIDEAEQLTAMLAGGAPASWEKLLFFDTETTGLGVGTGNLPFMLGFGYYRSDALVVEQCFLRSPADEPAMLAYFARVLQRFTHIVSYNGRAFDWPVMRNRYVLHRIDWSDDHLQQLDFLYASRSLWKRILPSCSLGSVEAGRLGYVREEDVPGSLAPTLYYQYLQSGEPEVVAGVFAHNEQDILSLAGLASYFAGVLSGRIPFLNMESEELLRLAGWLDKVGRTEQADEAYDWLLGRPEEELRDVALELAAALKRRGRLEEAVRLWKLSIAQEAGAGYRLEPYLELAMYYEHRAKQFDEALRWTERAGDIAARRIAMTRRSAKEQALAADIAKRRNRLLNKLNRSTEEREGRAPFAGDLFDLG
jgi:hypothetical protein